ncbi:MAG: uroporphyrinogen decarboxylase family protein [Methylacidiphilales bacterium]|nr:uroporphyrinogen decarboxylase family protein [Candidatus Methylacidiphilales bacterium]
MTSQERIMAAIGHREPDRVPVDLGATPSSGISAIAYGNLKNHLGLTQGHTRVYDVVQQLAQPEDFILDRFGVDVVDIGRAFNTEDAAWLPTTLADGQTAQYPGWFHPERQADGSLIVRMKDGLEIACMPARGTFFDQTYFPYLDDYPEDFRDLPAEMSRILWAALAHSPWDHANDPGFWDTLRANALELRRTSDRALMLVIGCNLFEWGTFLRRMDNFLMDLVAEPEKVEALLDALMERHMAVLEKACHAVGDVADVIRFGDDLGTNEGPFMSPVTYRKLFKPRHKMLCDYVHKHSGMKTFLHSCGSIRAVMPDLIEAGFDVINPVQTICMGMEPRGLKADFGKDICFWGGGCDTRNVLPNGTPAEVKDHVKRQMEIFMPGGGFVFNTVHNILPDVPPQNIVAMFEAVREFSR